MTTITNRRHQVLQANDDFRTNILIPVLDRIPSELQRRFADDICSIYHRISALHPDRKQFLDQQKISVMATNYQVNLPDLSAEIHTTKPLLQRKKIDADNSDTQPPAMDSTLRFLVLLEPYRGELYELYRFRINACTLTAT